MKQFIIHAVAAVSGFVCLVSCSEQESLFSTDQSSTRQLRIVTRTGEGGDPLASVFLFNGNSTFVRSLQTDDAGSYTTASASVKLPEGTYTLYALGPGDLSGFQIPDNPTLTSAITPISASAMGDLLMATATVTLSDGDAKTVNMTLERKVLELSSVTISQVPDDVMGVTVTVTPFYSAIQFNGTYVETNPVTATFTLTETATAGVWQTTTPQLVFPSIGTPTITVTFTRSEGEAVTFTYTELSALTANNKYDIAGNYTEPLGITLSGAITTQSWPSTGTDVPFDFDNTNTTSNTDPGTDPGTGGSGTNDPTEAPVAGQQYKGCFIVSVNETNRTAVLLSPDEELCKPDDGKDPTNWRTFIEAKLDLWPSISGVSGDWRLPYNDEVDAFALDSDFMEGVASTKWKALYFLDGTTLKVAKYIKKATGNIEKEIITETNSFSQLFYIRPVIDIVY